MVNQNIKNEMIRNFKRRNIEVSFFTCLKDACEKIQQLIPISKTVGIGNSQTLKDMDISKILSSRGNKVFDKTLAQNKEDSIKLKKKALLSNWYISGTNAVSIEGHIVNIDHSGNRVAAMIYGPDNVIIVIGKNKICNTLDEAIQRAKNISAPLNAKRAGYNPPCIKEKRCVDCKSKERVCFNLVIIEGQHDKNRMKLFVVDEDFGF